MDMLASVLMPQRTFTLSRQDRSGNLQLMAAKPSSPGILPLRVFPMDLQAFPYLPVCRMQWLTMPATSWLAISRVCEELRPQAQLPRWQVHLYPAIPTDAGGSPNSAARPVYA